MNAPTPMRPKLIAMRTVAIERTSTMVTVAAIRRTSGIASTTMSAVARAVKTPTTRSARDVSKRTAANFPAAAEVAMRVKMAVTMETTTSDVGNV